MPLAVGVLAILAVPFIVVAIDPNPQTPFYVGSLIALGVLAVALFGVAFVLEPKKGPDERLVERRIDRYMNVLTLDTALVLDIGALAFSTTRSSLVPIVCGLAALWTLIWIPRFTHATR